MCDTFETNERQAYQNIVAASVTQNQLSEQPWKALFRFSSKALSYLLHCFQHLKLNWARSQFCVSFLDQSEMTQQDMPNEKKKSLNREFQLLECYCDLSCNQLT